MPKTVRQVSYSTLKNGHSYTIGEYGQVLFKMGLFGSFESFRKWHYRSKKKSVEYSNFFFKPQSEAGTDRIETKSIKTIIGNLRPSK